MWWIDGHLDLAYLAVSGRNLRVPVADPQREAVSLPDLRRGDVRVAFGTIYTEPEGTGLHGYPRGEGADAVDAANRAGRLQLDVYEALERLECIEIVRTREDLDRASSTPKIVLLMEGADPIRSTSDAGWWVRRGLRLVGLTWSTGTRYAGGNAEPHGPLTPAGRELLRALDELGVVHDLSHLSDEAAADLLEVACGRVVATHSNCRALLPPRQRHVTDEIIREIGRRDGIVGLNLCGSFLARDGRATIDDAANHVEHVAEVMGHRRGVALGSDMDGGFPPTWLPRGLDHPTKLDHLAERLADRGWSDEDVAAFAHGNWLRLLREILPASS